MPFRVALSGLNAASADLNVTANNIANASTIGFKTSRAEFADVFAVGAQEIGNGTRLANVSQTFSQGGIDFTDRGLDLAISGEGFFTMSDAGSITYSRVGAFGVDRDGFVTNSQNQRLQIFPAASNGSFNTGTLSDLQLSTTDSPPQATTQSSFGVNLPAAALPPAIGVFDPANASSFNHSTAVTVYDSLGATHTATVYFVRDAVPNTWDAYFYIDGNAVGGANPLVYDNLGQLTVPATGTIPLPAYTPGNGSADITMTADFTQSTQFGSEFGVNLLSQDGFAAGRLSNIDVDPEGIIFARFTNGRSEPLGQVALSNFTNSQGLRQLGDTSWGETFTSGDAIRGAAGTASFGFIQSGALEASNVDLTGQLVQMITAQRGFQANAQMISTADQVTQTIINIR
ncbi:MAG: flagellar hook protein FlgE [Gammaproteobacteria bacterium]|nr:flagellar hook protein FlgE [Gammaproteobacteria bacterium]MDH3506770.1 flagellar hook protein FlgE [Gammaproteobacteria bacterium]